MFVTRPAVLTRARHAIPCLLAMLGLAASFDVAASTPVSISGSPPTSVAAGKLFTFTPNATGSHRRRLTFNISNKPAWASFSISTGTLSGTPATANIGTSSNIDIAVTDGRTQAKLAPFSVTVTGTAPPTAANGTASLTWLAPTQNSDGSALTNLAGYQIDYGTASNTLNKTVKVANPGASSYTVTNLPSGTWYFAVQAYTNSGAQSTLSNVSSKAIK